MIILISIIGLAGFFFYTPLFYIGGFTAFLLWVLNYTVGKFLFYSRLQSGSSPSTMAISSLITMMIISGILYFFFDWKGVAWLGIAFGILVPTKRNYTNNSRESNIQAND